MAVTELLSEREEMRALQLARRPKSAAALQNLFDKVKARATEVVLNDPKVKARLQGTRYRVMGGELRVEKPPDGRTMAGRVAQGGIYDYDRNVLVVAVVDLRAGRVLGIEEWPDVQPPITPEELEEAKQIVFSDKQYASLKKSRPEVAAFPSRAITMPDHPGYGHRCFTLYFWSRGKRIGHAVVDLSMQRLVPGVDEPGFPASDRG